MKAVSSGLSTGLPARWPQIDGIGRKSAFCENGPASDLTPSIRISVIRRRAATEQGHRISAGRKLLIDYVQLDTTNTDRSLAMAAELAGRGGGGSIISASSPRTRVRSAAPVARL